LAKPIAAARPAVRFSPDDWLTALAHGIWDGEMRERIEQLQKFVAADVLRSGASVVIEWGTWVREERDVLRDLARSLGARAELVIIDLLWTRFMSWWRYAEWKTRRSWQDHAKSDRDCQRDC
jgi:predicted kinase